MPFIVADAGGGSEWLSRPCEYYSERWPEGRMRMEYTRGEGVKYVPLAHDAWRSRDRWRLAHGEHMAEGGKVNAPYVWHIKDGGVEAPPHIRASVQREWRPPYFVRGYVNRREANESQELWFSRRRGAVFAHADTYCTAAVSLQLSGRKRWRLMPAPPIASSADLVGYHDGRIYGSGKWKPAFEGTVEEGEAIVFPPGLFHETLVPEEGNPACTASSTFQLQLPAPSGYVRAFLPSLALSHLYSEGHCRQRWHSYATLAAPAAVPPTLDRAACLAAAAALLRQIDADGDGGADVREIEAHLSSPDGATAWARWFVDEDYFSRLTPSGGHTPSADERVAMEVELLRGRAADTLVYHDVDGDGRVSAGELGEAALQWHAVEHRARAVEETRAGGWESAEAEAAAVAAVERRYEPLQNRDRSPSAAEETALRNEL